MKGNKNIELLKSFTVYCELHPEQRFWQALRNWAKLHNPAANFVLFATDMKWDGKKTEAIGITDTFYLDCSDIK